MIDNYRLHEIATYGFSKYHAYRLFRLSPAGFSNETYRLLKEHTPTSSLDIWPIGYKKYGLEDIKNITCVPEDAYR